MAGNAGSGNRKRTGGSTRSASGRSSGRNTSRSSSASRSRSSSKNEVQSGFADYWHAFTKTRAFKPVMLIVSIILIVLIDLLISWNTYDRFFFILGIEILIVAAFWVGGLIFSISKDNGDQN